MVKPIFGSQGKNIFMINKPDDLKGTEITGGVFYVQEFINSEKKNIILKLLKYSFRIKASFYKRLILIFYRITGIHFK